MAIVVNKSIQDFVTKWKKEISTTTIKEALVEQLARQAYESHASAEEIGAIVSYARKEMKLPPKGDNHV